MFGNYCTNPDLGFDIIPVKPSNNVATQFSAMSYYIVPAKLYLSNIVNVFFVKMLQNLGEIVNVIKPLEI